jgi:hypothetical protein
MKGGIGPETGMIGSDNAVIREARTANTNMRARSQYKYQGIHQRHIEEQYNP